MNTGHRIFDSELRGSCERGSSILSLGTRHDAEGRGERVAKYPVSLSLV